MEDYTHINNEGTDESELSSNFKLVIPSNLIEDVHAYEGNPIKEKVIAFLGAFAVTGLVVVGVSAGVDHSRENEEIASALPIVLESVPKPPETPHPFQTLSIQAKAAVVYDVHKETVLFGKNEEKQYPLASLTKLMTALLAVESLEGESHIALSPESIQTEGDSGLLANESWKVSDLVHFTMLTSSNDGASALAGAVGALWQSTPTTTEEVRVQSFVDRMNFRADELGLKDTTYTNPTGLDNTRYGGYGTAKDMSLLLTYVWEHEPDTIRYTNEAKRTFVSLDSFEHVAENTNEYVYTTPGLLGGKTGYTDEAGGNLAVIFDAGLNHPITVVVLGSTIEGRFTDVQALVDATYEYVTSGWYEYEMNTGGTTPLHTGSTQ